MCLSMDGTNDGGTVVNASSKASAAVANQLLTGVAVTDISAGDPGEGIVWGYIEELRVIRGTRGASTDSYAASPAIAVGDQLVVETVGNGFTRAGAAATGALVNIVALETAASSASASSNTADTSIVRVDRLKAYIRMM